MKVVITGADGFIGKNLLNCKTEYDFIPVVRFGGENFKGIEVGDIATFGEWEQAFDGVNVIVHLAAIAYSVECGDKKIYHENNTAVVEKMLCAANNVGVKRFIFISSVKVNGESTNGIPFTPYDKCCPSDAYARSKAAAERLLLDAAKSSDVEIVIIRPPLVYGVGVKANFLSLMKIASLPLPFASVNNRRDMISVHNLCDLIICCINHPLAKNQIFLASDGRPYSLTELLRVMAAIQGGRSFLWPFPVKILSFFFDLLGREDISQRLFKDLEVDISITEKTLGWFPKYTLEDTLRKMLP